VFAITQEFVFLLHEGHQFLQGHLVLGLGLQQDGVGDVVYASFDGMGLALVGFEQLEAVHE